MLNCEWKHTEKEITNFKKGFRCPNRKNCKNMKLCEWKHTKEEIFINDFRCPKGENCKKMLDCDSKHTEKEIANFKLRK